MWDKIKIQWNYWRARRWWLSLPENHRKMLKTGIMRKGSSNR